ncbi:MAG TPA: hypothetical protein DHU96_21905, partial [Actinobacteria bacterium]|nr:hypothetical protein [Actinomycetota bacterium]
MVLDAVPVGHPPGDIEADRVAQRPADPPQVTADRSGGRLGGGLIHRGQRRQPVPFRRGRIPVERQQVRAQIADLGEPGGEEHDQPRLARSQGERARGQPGQPYLVLDFWQAACPPCRALEPRLEAFARRHPGVFTAYRIDIDTDQHTPDRFGVMSIPTLLWLRDGTEAARLA